MKRNNGQIELNCSPVFKSAHSVLAVEEVRVLPALSREHDGSHGLP